MLSSVPLWKNTKASVEECQAPTVSRLSEAALAPVKSPDVYHTFYAVAIYSILAPSFCCLADNLISKHGLNAERAGRYQSVGKPEAV